jgi:hypothetical protein
MSYPVTKGSVRRAAVAGAAVGIALLLVAAPGSSSARASDVSAGPVLAGARAAPPAQLTDVGAAKRKRRAVRRQHGPSAAGMAFMGMAMGMIGTAIAESQRRDYYDHYYYGRPTYYGPRYYRAPAYGYYGGVYQPRPYYYGY